MTERCVRDLVDENPAVLAAMRKRGFGCDSKAGCRFIERVQTSRLLGRRPLEYLPIAVAPRGERSQQKHGEPFGLPCSR